MGSDHQHATGYPRFAVYSETTNTWVEKPRPFWFPSITETAMHGYDHSAMNPATGELYHRPFTGKRMVWRYRPWLDAWQTATTLPTSLIASDADLSCCIGVEYFPEAKTLVFVDGDPGKFFSFGTTTGRWTMHATGLTMGSYHNFAEYNPVVKVVVGGGGNGSSDIYKLDTLGAVTKMRNAPFGVGTMQSVFTVDPVSGDYLVFNASSQFYAYNVRTDTWTQKSGTVPIFTSASPVVTSVVATPVSTYGVNVFVSCDGANCEVNVYKNAEASGAESASLRAAAPALAAFPNPFSGSTILSAAPGNKLRIYDLHGRCVTDLTAGHSGGRVAWNAESCAPGLYVAALKTGKTVLQEKLILLK